jgi:hypothetical protein
MFSSAFTFSFPPEVWALEAYAKLVEMVASGCPWMAAGLAVDGLTVAAAHYTNLAGWRRGSASVSKMRRFGRPAGISNS